MSLILPKDALRRIPAIPLTLVSRLSSSSRPPVAMSQSKHNPHPDFKMVEAGRKPWDQSSKFRLTKTIDPAWSFGSGANEAESEETHISIDPYASGRSVGLNYKLLISAITPRPIAFLSTLSTSGEPNLAPFSYFSLAGHDPPLFTVSFSSSLADAKDTIRNLIDTRECVINIISEGYVEAANSCSVDSPHGVSEWAVSGLTPASDCVDVKCARVKEAVFAVEGKLESVREFESRETPGKMTTILAVIEGTRFWVREDAVNAERSIVDPAVLRPISRLGGIMYGRTTEAMEILRPGFEKDIGGMEGYQKLKAKAADGKPEA